MEFQSKVVPPLGDKSSEESRKTFVTSHLTQPPIKPRLLNLRKFQRTTNSQMVKLFLSTPQDSWVQRLFSTQDLLRREMKL